MSSLDFRPLSDFPVSLQLAARALFGEAAAEPAREAPAEDEDEAH
ncbi:hypothetical protein ACFOMD_16090 [Sphingoaurantiacus capsulatus]|uniref:Uncharacterized protein n=1 Tax=Sphingoaurantiacus capsulatus TaxID=1771310 RepID=A0ABV7XFM2_9SPHN